MHMNTELKTILDGISSAVAAEPGNAAVRISADCKLVGVHEVDVQLDGHAIKSDQPAMLGGNDRGSKPVEIALAALGSCQAQTYRFWSEKLGIHIDDITVDIEGDIDIRGIFGLQEGVRPGFGGVRMNVSIRGPESRERYEELHRTVNAHCPVLDMFTVPVPVTTAISVN